MGGLRRTLAAKKAARIEVIKVTVAYVSLQSIYAVWLKTAATNIILGYTLYGSGGTSLASKPPTPAVLPAAGADGIRKYNFALTKQKAARAQLTIQVTVGGKTTTVEYSGYIIDETA